MLMNCVWDNPLNAIVPAFDTPIAHWLVLISCLLSAISWLLSGQHVGLRQLSAMAFGSAVALGLTQLLVRVLAA